VQDWAREERLEAYDQATAKGYLRHLVVREGRNTGQALVQLVTHERERFEAKATAPEGHLMKAPKGSHFLHTYLLRFTQGQQRVVFTGRGNDPSQISSWILLKGRLLLELPQVVGGKSVIVDAGNVMHFREHGKVTVQPLQDSIVIQIVHSQVCECTQTMPPSD